MGKAYGYVENSPALIVRKAGPFSFFRMSILKQGNRVQLSNLEDEFPQRAFLPSQIASGVSLVETDLQKVFPQSLVTHTQKEMLKLLFFIAMLQL